MKGLARATGMLFVLIGLLAIVIGGIETVRALTRADPLMPGLFSDPEMAGALLPLRLMFGGIAILQGLMLAALGEGLWLLTSLAENSEKSSGLLSVMVPRGSLRIP